MDTDWREVGGIGRSRGDIVIRTYIVRKKYILNKRKNKVKHLLIKDLKSSSNRLELLIWVRIYKVCFSYFSTVDTTQQFLFIVFVVVCFFSLC